MEHILYLVQFYDRKEIRHNTFVVHHAHVAPVSQKHNIFMIPREIRERCEMLAVLLKQPSYIQDIQMDEILLKCRDNAATQRRMVVRQQDLLRWVLDGMDSKQLPPTFRVSVL